jgi:hypothetical protein
VCGPRKPESVPYYNREWEWEVINFWSSLAQETFADLSDETVVVQVEEPNDCTSLQKAAQRLGSQAVRLGGISVKAGVVGQVTGLGIATIGASRLNPNVTIGGGYLTYQASKVTLFGGLLTAGGATLMTIGGSGKEAVVELTSRALTRAVPAGPSRDAFAQILEPAIRFVVPDIKACR